MRVARNPATGFYSNWVVGVLPVRSSTGPEEFGLIPQCGFSRTRTAERNKILSMLNSRCQRRWRNWVGVCNADSREPALRSATKFSCILMPRSQRHWGEFGWILQCGFSRTRAAECNQIFMHFESPLLTCLRIIWLHSAMRIPENPRCGVESDCHAQTFYNSFWKVKW